MVATEDRGKVQHGEFAWIDKPWGPKTKSQPFAKISGCNRVLTDAMTDFGVTAWGLSRLLGLPWIGDIYKWLGGEHRPSQMYMTRLVKLYQLHNYGLKLSTVHHINWDGDGGIYLRSQVKVSGTGGITPPKRPSLSPQQRKDQELRDKWMGQSPR